MSSVDKFLPGHATQFAESTRTQNLALGIDRLLQHAPDECQRFRNIGRYMKGRRTLMVERRSRNCFLF